MHTSPLAKPSADSNRGPLSLLLFGNNARGPRAVGDSPVPPTPPRERARLRPFVPVSDARSPVPDLSGHQLFRH